MHVAYCCPKCDATNDAEVNCDSQEIRCAACDNGIRIPTEAFQQKRLSRCTVCPSTDLFIRKDFPQRLGVIIVTVGLLGSCFAWAYSQLYLTFAILFATALIDVVLYFVVPDALMCYRCGAIYRNVQGLEEHGMFDLETHERHRQQKIRLASFHRESVGTNI